MIEIFLGFICVFGYLVLYLVKYARKNYGSLESIGIPVIKPKFILGSQPNLHKLITHEEDVKNRKIYGQIYGVYQGSQPVVYLSDPGLIRKIFSKDTDYFQDMRRINYGSKYINELLPFLPNRRWKIIRSAMNSSFSAGRVRQMRGKFIETGREFSEYLDAQIQSSSDVSLELNIRDFCFRMAIDLTAKCFFGMKIRDIFNPDHPFLNNLKRINFSSDNINFMLPVAMTFPFLAKIKPFIPPEPVQTFINQFSAILEESSKNPDSSVDLVNALNSLLKELDSPEGAEKFRKAGLTRETIISQGITMIIGGYDTQMTTLAMVIYSLAKYPDVDARVSAELKKFYEKYPDGFNSESNFGELTYLNAVIQETLRLYPSVTRVERHCNKDWVDEETGQKILKGMDINISPYALHSNPDLWPNPEEFDPERFIGKDGIRDYGYKYASFGFGSHFCIGYKFAMEGMTINLAEILHNFRFELTPSTEIRFKPGSLVMVQQHPINLRVYRRKGI